MYKLVFKNIQNLLGIPKPLALAILIIGFLVLPTPIKTMLIVIAITAFAVWLAFFVEHNNNQSRWMQFIRKWF
ncbi:MAG: hypothetical protein IE909_05685 [Campylobacterales bacterium]|nr:hypothetical protein [Campylobacterales bacterium]